MSSEERFSIDSGLQEDAYEASSSSDCPPGEAAAAAALPLNPSLPTNGVHLPLPPTLDGVFDPKEPTDFLPENPSNMLAHESFSGPGMASHQQDAIDELFDAEDQDSTINESSWVERHRNCGMDPRLILAEILPKGTFIPSNVNDGLLWRYILNVLNEPKRAKLTHVNTLDDATHLLRTCTRIIVLTGAGVSVSCGIPDFRSRNGIYARLSKDYPDLPDPQAMFDITYFRRDPRPFFKFAKEIYPGQFQPSPSHRFIRLLERQGRLLRNYTQNIDTLEHAAGIRNVITCHGSFATATCTVCRYKVDSSVIKEDIFNQTIPYCPVCPSGDLGGERGIMKPDIVFFGEGLSDEFHDCMNADKQTADLLIVIGSSLKVRPVAMIPSSIPTNVPQILINREPLKHLTFDIELLGDCDVIIGELCRRLQSEWSIEEDIPSLPLREIPRPPLPAPFPSLAPSLDPFAPEINNNFSGSSPAPSQVAPPPSSQGEESNSCDYHGLSAIKLDDSEDGSDHAHNDHKPAEESGLERLLEERDANKKLPDNSYFFFPPNRYVFQGAEVDKEDDEDCCSTSTDYSSDSDAPPPQPPSAEGPPPPARDSHPPSEHSSPPHT